jgi:hypothetical protein
VPGVVGMRREQPEVAHTLSDGIISQFPRRFG